MDVSGWLVAIVAAVVRGAIIAGGVVTAATSTRRSNVCA
jgi:hypothetical protein